MQWQKSSMKQYETGFQPCKYKIALPPNLNLHTECV